jgi:aspartate/methionine/tyrosine aminotransferase
VAVRRRGLPGRRARRWRHGELPEAFIEAAWARTDYTSIAPGILSDEVARRALEPALRARIFERNRSLLRENLVALREWMAAQPVNLTLTPPRAGGMAFIRYEHAMNSSALTTRLREEKSVLIVAGDCFGLDGYLRIGFGAEPGYLRRGLERLGEFLAEIA